MLNHHVLKILAVKKDSTNKQVVTQQLSIVSIVGILKISQLHCLLIELAVL